MFNREPTSENDVGLLFSANQVLKRIIGRKLPKYVIKFPKNLPNFTFFRHTSHPP